MLGMSKPVEGSGAKRRAGSCAALAVLGALLCSAAHAQLNITITKGIPTVPIAVVPFGWSGAGAPAYDLAGVVSADLKSSGRFAPLPPANLPSRPTEPSQVNYTDWRLVKVDNVVIGTLSESGPDQFTAVFQLYDVNRGEQILGYRLTASR